MDRIKSFIKWVTKRIFPISIVVFVLIYIWWFRLTPWESQDDNCCSNGEYKLGLTLLFTYSVLVMVSWLARNRNFFRMFFRFTMILFFILNSWYITALMPKVIDHAKYNEIEYYLVSYHVSFDTPWKTATQLTKWYGGLNYETHYMDSWAWNGEIFYDKKTNLVNVVARNHLLFTDASSPRYYKHDSRQLDGHLYYVSSQCIYCNSYPYTIYKCDLDNTSCILLPFQYTGNEMFEKLDVNEVTKELEFYISTDFESDILVYSYGENPRCFVDGCEILEILE